MRHLEKFQFRKRSSRLIKKRSGEPTDPDKCEQLETVSLSFLLIIAPREAVAFDEPP